MDNLWLKIKIWTKVVIISVVVIFLLIFVMENANKEITIWWWFGREVATTALMLIGTLLVRVAAKTMRQVRELKQHNANLQMRQDVAEIKTKAAMLQTKPPITPSDAANKGN